MSADRKVVVVTGASRGLGEAFVKAYRERGWRAVGNARSITPSDDPDYITVRAMSANLPSRGESLRPRSSGSAASTR